MNTACTGVARCETDIAFPVCADIQTDTQSKRLHADHIFSTLPARTLVHMLPDELGGVKALLGEISHSTNIVVVNLVYRKSDVDCPDGFGYLIPGDEGEGILGVTWDTKIFPEQMSGTDTMKFTVMLGGERGKNALEMSDEAILELVAKKMSDHMHVSGCPLLQEVRRLWDCIPQYPVGHAKRVEEIESLLQRSGMNLTMLGTSFYGVGVADCVARSKWTAYEFIRKYFENI